MYQGLRVADTPIHVAYYVKQAQKLADAPPVQRDRASSTSDSDDGDDLDCDLRKNPSRGGGSTWRGARAGGCINADNEVRRCSPASGQ